VVAYESLCILESAPASPSAVVANWFTVGAALSIWEVQKNLMDAAQDGHKPKMVANWYNLDAHADLVGGTLRAKPFAITDEFLELSPFGCGSPTSPVCAHSSYFTAGNAPVNRDIFGKFIEGMS
jgi:hypothetical protein